MQHNKKYTHNKHKKTQNKHQLNTNAIDNFLKALKTKRENKYT